MTDRTLLILAVKSLYPHLDNTMMEVAVDFHLKYPDSDVDAVLGDLLTGGARDFFSELESKRPDRVSDGEEQPVEVVGPDAGYTRDQPETAPVPTSS
jgi:hypothetical protein